MSGSQQYETLLYQHELLLARLRIREHYLGTVVKEVYENIGQMLSLIRIKLLGLHHNVEDKTQEAIDTSGEMVGKTITDLRKMCRLFYPEEDITAANGFYRVMKQEFNTRFPMATCEVNEKATLPAMLTGGNGLIVFGILLGLFDSLEKENTGAAERLKVRSTETKVQFEITYTGNPLNAHKEQPGKEPYSMSETERARLLGGRLTVKKEKTGQRKIKLELPKQPSA